MAKYKKTNFYETIEPLQKELLCSYSKSLKLTWVNDAYANYFKRDKNDLIGKSFLELVPSNEHKKLKQVHKALSKDSPTIFHIDEVLAPDGKSGWQEWKNIAVFNEDGKFVEFRAVGTDVTEIIELKTRLNKLENSISSEIKKQNAILMGIENGKQVIVNLADIFYIEAKLKNSIAITANGSIQLQKSIGVIHRDLEKLGFFRIHRSYLVSIDKIERIEKINGSRFKVHIKIIHHAIESSREGARKLKDLSFSKTRTL